MSATEDDPAEVSTPEPPDVLELLKSSQPERFVRFAGSADMMSNGARRVLVNGGRIFLHPAGGLLILPGHLFNPPKAF
jgi:hypothetical protein